jgi:hypothetical protein
MSLEIVAGLLGSQLVRAVACEIATTLLCQTIEHAVTTVAQPRSTAAAAGPSGAAVAAAPARRSDASLAAAPAGRAAAGVTAAPVLRVLPSVEVVSIVAGRVRLRVHGLRDNAARADAIAATIGALPGVTSAKANATTGTLLVRFDQTETSVAAIVSALEPARPVGRLNTQERTSHLRLVVG